MKNPYGSEDLRSIVSNRVLTSPLLKEENRESDEESRPVPFAQKRFPWSQIFKCFTFLLYRSFNFGKFTTDRFGVDIVST